MTDIIKERGVNYLLQSRYENDATFHSLVQWFYRLLHEEKKITETDIRDAINFSYELYEQDKLKHPERFK